MAVYFQNMTDSEVGAMVKTMIESGEKLDLSSVTGPKVDKHSTGALATRPASSPPPLQQRRA